MKLYPSLQFGKTVPPPPTPERAEIYGSHAFYTNLIAKVEGPKAHHENFKMAQYTFRVTGKGRYNAPKGATVQVIKSSSTITMPDIKDAFKKQLGIDVSGCSTDYDIKKMF